MSIVQALKKTAKIYGVTDFADSDTVDELVEKVNGGIVFGSSNVTVAGVTPDTTEYWGTKVSDMQESVVVANGAITGTLKKLTTGQLVTDWGEGYFIALKFTKNNNKATTIKVGLRPSVSSGLLPLDPDMDGVFKITDKDNQVLIVRPIDADGNEFTSIYDLSGLTLSDE